MTGPVREMQDRFAPRIVFVWRHFAGLLRASARRHIQRLLCVYQRVFHKLFNELDVHGFVALATYFERPALRPLVGRKLNHEFLHKAP